MEAFVRGVPFHIELSGLANRSTCTEQGTLIPPPPPTVM